MSKDDKDKRKREELDKKPESREGKKKVSNEPKSKKQKTSESNSEKEESEQNAEELDEVEIFADPTFDVTFKMLFGNENNKDVLISLINNLLGFKGNKKIIDVQINSNELPISFFSDEKKSGITSSVDILCTNEGKQKIAIEMQGQRTKYFLAREQEYMAKLISGQVKQGEGKKYDEKVLETYIIVIGKSNIFWGKTALKNQKIFEIDVKPIVVQTNEEFPGNKMFWKFYELLKFKDSNNYNSISKTSPLKEQWLEFLIDCSKQKEEPDRNEIIIKGYDIMKVAKWTPDMKTLYWKQKANEQDVLETIEEEKQEEFDKGKLEGKLEGELKGKIEGEIDKVKTLVKFGIDNQKIIESLHILNDVRIHNKLDENITYIRDHLNDSDGKICVDLNLIGLLNDSVDI